MMKLERLRWLILGLLFLSTVLNYVDRQALSLLLPTLRTELHLTSADYGVITTVFMLAYTIGQIPSGMLLDKIGTRIGFGLFVGLWSVSALLHAFARGAVSLGVYRAFLGITEAGNWPAGGKTVANWFPQKNRAFAMAIFDAGSAIGAIISPPIVAFLAMKYGWREAFVATGSLGIIWLAAWLWIYHEPENHPWLSAEDRATVVQEVGAKTKKSASFSGALKEIIGARQLWGLFATRFVATSVWWFYVFWLPDYLSKGRGFSLLEIGLYAWIPYLTVDIGKMLGGKLSDSMIARGRSVTFARKSVMVGGALAMLGGLCVVSAPNAAASIAWASLATFGFGMWSANILALHADIFSPNTMGTAVGFTGTGASLGGAVFTYVVGQVVDSSGYTPVFYMVGLLAMVACLILLFGVGKIERIAQT
ncbi:MAG: MFS transporter [Gloeobacteraceae cyanobacterium ES-bin-144]|nr:MFS transporter [Verrucomicrobiales bacterium]